MICLSLRCKNNNVVDIQQDRLCLFAVSWDYFPPTIIDHLASSDVDLHLPYDLSFQYYI